MQHPVGSAVPAWGTPAAEKPLAQAHSDGLRWNRVSESGETRCACPAARAGWGQSFREPAGTAPGRRNASQELACRVGTEIVAMPDPVPKLPQQEYAQSPLLGCPALPPGATGYHGPRQGRGQPAFYRRVRSLDCMPRSGGIVALSVLVPRGEPSVNNNKKPSTTLKM